MTPKDFAAAWGEQHLVVFSMDALTSVNIPMSSKRFLAEGGLPRQAPLPSDRDGLHLLPPEAPLKMLPGGDEFRLMEKVGEFWLLAIRWYRCLIALDQKGRVVTHSDEGLRLGRAFLMNSSVSHFAETLLACRASKERFGPRWSSDYPSFLEMSKTPEYARFVTEASAETDWLEAELRRIDPAAMARPDSYWSGVLEDLRQI